MKHCLILSALAPLASAVWADAPFFQADFDSPVMLNGVVEAFEPEAGARVEGRIGRACSFMPPAVNVLKPGQVADEIHSPSGVVEIAGIRAAQEVRWRSWWRDAAVGSAWVKGEKGDVVEVSVSMTCPNETPEKLAEHEKKLLPSVRARVPKATDARICRYETFPQKVTLDGTWQRVAAHAFCDPRLSTSRRSFGVRFASAAGRPLAVRRAMFEVKYVEGEGKVAVAPGAYAPPGQTLQSRTFYRDLTAIGAAFPVTNGTFAAWVRCGERGNLRPETRIFFQSGGWELGPKTATVDGGIGALGRPFDPASDAWQHVAVTWSPTEAVLYRDGVEAARVKRRLQPGRSVREFRLGGWGVQGRNASSTELDEVGIWAKAFTAAEVAALMRRTAPLGTSSENWAVERVASTLFHRNERAAHLVTTVYAPTAQKAVFTVRVGDEPPVETKVSLAAGPNFLMLPFDARRFALGTYPFEITGREDRFLGRGEERLRLAGELEILPRLDRGCFRFFSWGGNNANLPVDYVVRCGLDAKQLVSTQARVRECADELQRKGLHLAVNTNPAHGDDGIRTGFDRAEMRRRLESDLGRFAGRYNWDMTLCTTEHTHPIHLNDLKGVSNYLAFARQELGHEPHFGIVGQASQCQWPKGYPRRPDGVFDPERDEVFHTFFWALRRGEHVQQVNLLAAETAHRLSPGNFAWSEPHNGGTTDATVIWDYTHDMFAVNAGFRAYSAFEEPYGVKWLPTIGMGTWPDTYGWLGGKKPADEEEAKKTRFSLMLTPDEVKMQSFLVLGHAKSENISYFDVDAWYEGEPHTAEPKPRARVADPGSPERLKAAIDDEIRPFGMLLRDMDVARGGGAAILLPLTSWHSHGLGWNRSYISKVWKLVLDLIPSLDILGDGVTAETCANYRHILFPGARNIALPVDTALAAASEKGTKVWTDFLCRRAYATSERFDSAPTNCLQSLASLNAMLKTNDYTRLTKLVESWRPLVREGAFAWVESSDGLVWSFGRACDGRKQYAVVNNLTGTTGPLNRFTDQADFRPYGKAAKATVSLKIPKDWTVYDFMTSRKLKAVRYENGRAFFELDLPAAGCALLAAYPAPLEKLTVTLDVPKAKPEGAATVRLTDATGACPKGRQIVRATVTDAATGAVRDESGWYVLKDGACRIPLYFPTTDKTRRVKVSLVEKTSGLTAEQ